MITSSRLSTKFIFCWFNCYFLSIHCLFVLTRFSAHFSILYLVTIIIVSEVADLIKKFDIDRLDGA
jgi:hypothetical protein